LEEIKRLSFREFVAQRVDQVVLRLKRALGLREKMRIGDNWLTLSPGHTLALNQRHHRLYDRFLPHLAASLNPGSMVIDVGANCGDTLAAMHDANPEIGFMAIEPHDEYYALLEQNVARLAAERSFQAHLVKSMVGSSAAGLTLVQSGGTAHAVLDTENAATLIMRKLDEVVETLGVDQIRLLKSDVDGFDYDVLTSATNTLKMMQPLVFFEAQVDYAFQHDGFEQVVDLLHDLGYKHWVLFDNFGSVTLRTDDYGAVKQLIDYTWKKRTVTPWRTIYYFDILTCVEADRLFVGTVVDGYEAAAV
jgi:FkbM family methyltransferase